MIIGNLTYDPQADTYTGKLATLSVGIRSVEFQPSESIAQGAPAYRVVSASEAGDVEFGAAWKKRSKDGKNYLSVSLDDPTMGQPFNCAVVGSRDDGERFFLVWSRKRPEDGKATPAKKPAAKKKAA